MSANELKGDLRKHGLVRFLAATVVIALLYIALQELWLSGFDRITHSRFAPSWIFTGDRNGEDARKVAEASAPREDALSPQHRRAAYELGFNVGSAAEFRGASLQMTDVERDQVGALAQAYETRAQELGRFLGVDDIQIPVSRTTGEHLLLAERLEADEAGLASKVEAATTPRHRHLYLMGAHVGMASVRIYVALRVAPGMRPSPPLDIAHHAHRAGLPRHLWFPLLETSEGKSADETVKTYSQKAMAVAEALNDPRTIEVHQ